MVAYIIYSDRLNATWVKCHLVANNPGGIYQGNHNTLYFTYHVSLVSMCLMTEVTLHMADRRLH